MSEKKLIGPATCPICSAPDAELWEGEKGAPYVKCDSCVGMCRSMSRTGRDKLRAFAKPAAAAPKPDAAPEPAPASPRRKYGFA